jgi:glucose-1-phosphate cytidylyltransferase
MKVVILAGGFGTRISEESILKPKPMIEIGHKPILWHIMKIYSFYGFNEFIICLGYKGTEIKEYFAHYFLNESDVTFNFTEGNNQIIHNTPNEPWKVTLVDTGLETGTGGRVKRVKSYTNNESFMLTYGDGLSDINIKKLLDYHKKHGKMVTLSAVQPIGRFGILQIDKDNTVTSFREKPQETNSWINGGFFVIEPAVFDYIESDNIMFEREPLERIADEGQLKSFKHSGFWYAMDKMSDKKNLESLWASGSPPWKVW